MVPSTREVALKMVRERGGDLAFVPWEFRDKEVCLAAVRSDGGALRFVPREIRIDSEILMTALRTPQDRETCLAALRANPFVLGVIRHDGVDRELCLAAVSADPRAFRYVPRGLRGGARDAEEFLRMDGGPDPAPRMG